jgi:hypothetical protein
MRHGRVSMIFFKERQADHFQKSVLKAWNIRNKKVGTHYKNQIFHRQAASVTYTDALSTLHMTLLHICIHCILI